MKLTPNILENLEYADIVRGSSEDFEILYKKTDADSIYRSQISFYTKNFILTQSSEPVELRAEGGISKQYAVEHTEAVSTIGAGDNFNAGFVYGLIKYGVTREMVKTGFSEELWDRIITCALKFSANVCKSIDNSVDIAFGKERQRELQDYLNNPV
jgi:fructokinase